MASYEKRGKTWRYVFYATIDGKKEKIQKGGFRTKQEAHAEAVELEPYYRKGIVLNNKVEFADYFKSWYETNKKDKVTQKTYDRYVIAHRLIKEYFNHTLLTELNRMDYQKFINEYAGNHSTDSTRKLNSYIRNCLDDAIHDGLIHKNATYKANTKGSVASKDEKDKYISHNEFKRLKSYLETKESMSSLLLLVIMVTGARFTEIQKMKRDDFNLPNNQVHIPGTKTQTSDRVISMDHKTLSRVKNFINSRPHDINGYVFSEHGTLITNNAVNKALKRACKQLNIKEITAHSLRHSLCSVLLHEGCSIHYISKRLGHKNINVTLSIYSHLLEETYQRDDEQAITFLNSI
ncbi:site-specific integrase [Mammaliicoccus vitulinus]|uniref:site-specific integrase n=1 Tax=Mammaliicoccus vitulinus TaxID=71237 RepID=UPI000D1D92E3|nr:site-specific integrase [Mammaliicoccus vitulinus]PTI71970.1 site-specific integrase [Mammaliicoccus vitulinus]